MTPRSLRVQLECELPTELAIGRGTAVFVCGWCFCPQARIAALDLVVAGERQPVMAHGMPRLDPYLELEDPGSYRSGFWGIARVAGVPVGSELELALEATLQDGAVVRAELARIHVAPVARSLPAVWPDPSGGPSVAICMATYNPPVDLLERQLESIRAQTHTNWICLISDDCSSPESFAALQRLVEDERFILSRSPRRLGFYRNFERALAMAPANAQFVAMADQDDVWHPDKLEVLLRAIGGAQLAFSDARVVSRDGALISETWWSHRKNNHSSLLSLLVANSVTGAASLFRHELLDYALPFPPDQFAHFHDHWIGLVALTLGEIVFVERALYDYVQHGTASLGHAAANRMTPLRDRVRNRRALSERVKRWRLHYFADACRLLQIATVLEQRCGERMPASKRQDLDRFLGAESSLPSLAYLGLRGLRELVGPTETLGAEWMLFHAFAWRRALALSARDQPQRRLRLDAVPPASLIEHPAPAPLPEPVRAIAEKIAPLRWAASDDAPTRINVLIPTVDLRHFFGGYIAKLNLARRLAERGLRIRVVTVDPTGPLPSDWQRALQSYPGLEGLLDRVEIAFGRESVGLEASRADGFIATTWWTAHIARDALAALGGDRFVYLIQEYEPFTFPMGSYAALAAESYRFPHFALFSSELLRDYFRRHGIGVYAAGSEAGDRASVAFENAITPIPPVSVEELGRRSPRRFLFYARPESHAARNMFELGVLALARALADGVLRDGWELHGIGTVGQARRIPLADGVALELLPRSGQVSYAELLRRHDVGLALMHTPHPSLVPIEMAAAGMLTVTNSFENKTARALSAISTNIITAEPTVDSIAAALGQAAAGASDLERRVEGSEVHWSKSWEQAFGDELLGAVVSALGIQQGDMTERAVQQRGVGIRRPGEQHPGLGVHRLAPNDALDDPRRA